MLDKIKNGVSVAVAVVALPVLIPYLLIKNVPNLVKEYYHIPMFSDPMPRSRVYYALSLVEMSPVWMYETFAKWAGSDFGAGLLGLTMALPCVVLASPAIVAAHLLLKLYK
jgi:hypothetical protein